MSGSRYCGHHWSDEAETQANRLAVQILMPAHLIQQEWGKGLSVEEMAKLFLVSRKAMEIRINGMIKQGLLSERKP